MHGRLDLDTLALVGVQTRMYKENSTPERYVNLSRLSKSMQNHSKGVDNLDSSLILSLIGIIISLFAIASPSKQRNFRHKFSTRYYLYTALFLVLFVVSLVLQAFYGMDGSARTLAFRYSILSFFLLTIISMFFTYLLHNREIKRKTQFVASLRDYYYANEYSKIITDLDIYFPNLMQDYLCKGAKPIKSAIWLPLTESEIKQNVKYNRKNKSRIRYTEDFNSLFEDMLSSHTFANELAIKNPLLGAKLIQSALDDRLKGLFMEQFVETLVLNSGSVLYSQIRNNQNRMTHHTGDNLDPKNYLLCALLGDIEESYDKLPIYKPVGEAVIKHLRSQSREDNDENIFDEDHIEQCWKSPVFIGIRFFDIMIHETILKSVPWHMWLYYFSHFTAHLTGNIRYHVDLQNREFEIMDEYYLYEIFSVYVDWIQLISYRYVRYEIKLESTDHSHQNDNAVKSSIISLSQSMRHVASSELRPTFKIYLFDMVVDLYLQLKTHKQIVMNQYGEVLLNCILNSLNEKSTAAQNMRTIMNDALANYDKAKLFSTKGGFDLLEELRLKVNTA